MAKLKLGALEDDKPVKVSLELPAVVHRELLAYAEVLALETGRPVSDPVKLRHEPFDHRRDDRRRTPRIARTMSFTPNTEPLPDEPILC